MKTLSALAIGILLGASVANATPIVVDANGVTVGFYMGLLAEQTAVEVAVSAKGFRFNFDRRTGLVKASPQAGSPGGYTTIDCSGQFYATGTQAAGFVTPEAENTSAVSPVLLFYVPQDAVPVIVSLASRRSSTGKCVESIRVGDFYPAILNDPSATGVPGLVLPAPLRVLSSMLFRNGFESAA